MFFLTQKPMLEKNKTAMIPDEKYHGLGTYTNQNPRKEEKNEKKWPSIYFFSDDFGLRSSVIQKIFQTRTAVIPLS